MSPELAPLDPPEDEPSDYCGGCGYALDYCHCDGEPCHACGGSGTIYDDFAGWNCARCGGDGYEPVDD